MELCLLSESIYTWKIPPDVYNNFSDFGGGGGHFGVHPPVATINTLEIKGSGLC